MFINKSNKLKYLTVNRINIEFTIFFRSIDETIIKLCVQYKVLYIIIV